MKTEALFHIGDLSKKTGVPARTIRYYEAMGLLRRPARNRHGYRLYASAAAERLRFIRAARSAGFLLKEIREILNMADEGKIPCRSVLQGVRRRSEDLDRQIAEMIAMKSKLEALLRQWATDLPRPKPKEICPLSPLRRVGSRSERERGNGAGQSGRGCLRSHGGGRRPHYRLLQEGRGRSSRPCRRRCGTALKRVR